MLGGSIRADFAEPASRCHVIGLASPIWSTLVCFSEYFTSLTTKSTSTLTNSSHINFPPIFELHLSIMINDCVIITLKYDGCRSRSKAVCSRDIISHHCSKKDVDIVSFSVRGLPLLDVLTIGQALFISSNGSFSRRSTS
jgi:hypothetical protein